MRRLAGIFAFVCGLALVGVIGAWVYLRSAPPPENLPRIIGKVDVILVEKSARRLTLIQDGKPVRQFPIALGFAPQGDKQRQGDGKTPEGVFRISHRNAASRYHLGLRLDYPQAAHRARAAAAGVDPGGDIMIHGQPNALPQDLVLRGDWTAGCIALSNDAMREVWDASGPDTLVEVRP